MEIEHEEYRREGYFFGTESFRLDLYRLLCCFLASHEFAKLRGRTITSKVAELDDQFSEFEIMRLLVDIAVKTRIVQDREREHLRRLTAECGYLIPDVTKPRSRQKLTLREACNKIIHAKKFNFDTRNIRVKDEHYVGTEAALRPFVFLYGQQDGAKWKAQLDIIQFAKRNAVFIQG